MITVQLNGRLGNQMFQYAAARALAHRWQTEVRFDLSLLQSTGVEYQLSCFGIPPRAASADELPFRQRQGTAALVRRTKSLSERLLPFVRKTVFSDEPFTFESDFFDHASNCYLRGFFQNEAYFSQIAGVIRKEFTVRAPLSDQTQQLLAIMKESAAVSVHVRRGDYIENASYNGYFGTCSVDYYARACAAMRAEISSPVFIFFSDDPTWVRAVALPALQDKGLVTDYVVVDWTHSAHPSEDIHLMKSACHHIIANSSFSWWGAWLNAKTSKKVIAPDRWLKELSSDSIVPRGWDRIPN